MRHLLRGDSVQKPRQIEMSGLRFVLFPCLEHVFQLGCHVFVNCITGHNFDIPIKRIHLSIEQLRYTFTRVGSFDALKWLVS